MVSAPNRLYSSSICEGDWNRERYCAPAEEQVFAYAASPKAEQAGFAPKKREML